MLKNTMLKIQQLFGNIVSKIANAFLLKLYFQNTRAKFLEDY